MNANIHRTKNVANSSQADPVVQKVNSVIHRIKVYSVDKAIGFPNTYPVDIENITRWRQDINF